MPRKTIDKRLLQSCLVLSAISFVGWNTVNARENTDEPPTPLIWKKKFSLETPASLPVSVAFSPGGNLLVIGGTAGRVVAIDLPTRREYWRSDVGGEFAAVAFASDGKTILATFEDGVRYLDSDTGAIRNFVIEHGSSPTAVGVFPDTKLDSDANQQLVSHKVIFGNANGWFVKIWTAGGFPSTISSPTVPAGGKPEDVRAAPLAVDPAGKCVIVTGPRRIDNGRNILWAWAAGNENPGNRILKGHQAVVVSAAWSKDGKTIVTGDAGGSVILWDAKTLQSMDRLELGNRIAAVALSPDGTRVAAAAIGKQAEFYAWEKAKPANRKLIHIDPANFASPVQACLAFSPNGQQLAGGAVSLAAQAKLPKVVGEVHLWECGKP